MHSISGTMVQLFLILGTLAYFGIIAVLLRKKKLNTQYSIIWIGSALLLLVFSVFPGFVAKIRDLSGIETDANFVFILLFAFILLLLLSLSTIVTGFAAKIKRLAQTQALLEKRIRELEAGRESQNKEARD